MKGIVILCVSVCLLFFVSCSGNMEGNQNPESKGLRIISNVETISPSKDIGGVVNGVRLVFHDGSGVTETSSFDIQDSNTFYLEYVGSDHVDSETGKTYNYNLFVPECIRTEYCAATGDSKTNGDSFWWYMNEYYKTEGLRTDWAKQLEELLNYLNSILEFPKESDVDDVWKQASKKNLSEFMTVDSSGRGVSDPEYIMNSFWIKKDDNGNPYLHFPCYVTDVYVAGGGKADYSKRERKSLYPQAFLWYMATYQNKTLEDLIEMKKSGELEAFLDSVNESYSYSQVKPEDVPMQSKTIVEKSISPNYEDEKATFQGIYCYKPECLVDNDGTIIEDSSRPYLLSWKDGANFRHVTLLVPEKFVRTYGSPLEGSSFSDNDGSGDNRWEIFGGCFWNYVISKGLTTDEEANTLVDDGCIVPVSWFQAVMEYKVP